MSFTIAHDYKNSKVAHMTGTGIVFIEYIGSIFEPHKFTLSARDNTLYDIFSGKLVKDPFNLAKSYEGKPIYFEDHLQAEKYYESMKYVLREYETSKGEIGDLLDKPRVYTEVQVVDRITSNLTSGMEINNASLSCVVASIESYRGLYKCGNVSFILPRLAVFTDRETPLYAIEDTDKHALYVVSMLKTRDIYGEIYDDCCYHYIKDTVLNIITPDDYNFIRENGFTKEFVFTYKDIPILVSEHKKCFDMTRLDNNECITTPYTEIFDDMSKMKKDQNYRGRRITKFIKRNFKWIVRDLTHDYK